MLRLLLQLKEAARRVVESDAGRRGVRRFQCKGDCFVIGGHRRGRILFDASEFVPPIVRLFIGAGLRLPPLPLIGCGIFAVA
jgi:hypothetical protein